jgi:predicted glycoside hydrolase/deacetylase ChbG (UPF0249 family)
MSRFLVVNGDDYGASRGINLGILEAHTRGILTSTSLMVNMPATQEAVALAAEHESLSIGLHVNFTNEGEDPVVDVDDADACAEELRHQYALFYELMGKPPSHLDSQHNVHFRPHLWPLFVEAAAAEAVPLRGLSPARYFANFFGQWDGETHLEHVSVENLKQMIENETKTPVTELACHPGYVDAAFETTYDVEREAELRSLCDPSLRHHLAELGITLISFAELGDVVA